MPTPRTQNRRSSDADRSTTLACVPWRIALIALILTVVLNPSQASAIALVLSSSTTPAGVAISGGSANFGTMDALQLLDSPSLNVSSTLIAGGGGTVYYTPFNLTVSGMNGTHTATITASSNNFTHSAALIAETCPQPYTGCTAPGSYSNITVAGNTLASGISNGTTITAGLAVWVPEVNGSTSGFAGTETITITFTATETPGAARTATVTLSLTAKTQTIIQFTLGGFGPLVGSPDYTFNFGNVNGLGIGAGGFGITSVSGGVVYTTPYTLNPIFAGFSSSTATIVVTSTGFTHSTQLIPQNATASGGPFTAINTTPITITSTAADRSTINRYLGLFVSSANGPTIYTGSDSATLTFTLTVP